MAKARIRFFEKLGLSDLPQVGGKNASLGELGRVKGLRVAPGFASTADAFREHLAQGQVGAQLKIWMKDFDAGRLSLAQAGLKARQLIAHAPLLPAFEKELLAAHARLDAQGAGVAVRSSATAEDLPDASFAGQQETFLNVRGPQALLKAVRLCFASLYTDRAISYRKSKKFRHEQVALSVGIQRMVRSDLASSGVMFTLDTDSGFPGITLINGAWGLGETVVQGQVDPDEWMVFKAGLKAGAPCPIVRRRLGAKRIAMAYAPGGKTRTRACAPALRARYTLSDAEVLELARMAQAIERHYGRPMDMEWAKDGLNNRLYIVQARPETVVSRKDPRVMKTFKLLEKGQVLAQGLAVGEGIAQGPACRVRSPKDLKRFKPGSILVAPMTDPDWVPIMRLAKGIVTDHGGRTCHAAIVSRELGIPAVVGTQDASRRLREGQALTLSCSEGTGGKVYAGSLKFRQGLVKLGRLPKTRTRVMVNLASPAAAFQNWHLPAQGVGLARMEFIISNAIRIHPMALLRWPKLRDADAVAEIGKMTASYRDKGLFFVERLAEGIGQIACTRWPDDVIVRLSDFKTNEYAGLLGGAEFEPHEENPMLGWRGASRYYDPRYREGFALECRALKQAREAMGLKNIVVMVPFCRTPREADLVLAEMAKHGLKRGQNGLRVYVMCEIPSNVLRAAEFARRFDGFSIGSNDLTQLTLGVDRDSSDLTSRFDERDEAVKIFIRQVIREAHRHGAKVGICGQAPSDHPEYPALLVKAGIDSISLNPDSLVEGIKKVARAETQKRRRA